MHEEGKLGSFYTKAMKKTSRIKLAQGRSLRVLGSRGHKLERIEE
jgi:hypothetical protein